MSKIYLFTVCFLWVTKQKDKMVCPVCILICIIIIAVLGFLFYTKVDSDMQLLFADKFGKSKNTLANKVVWVVGASSGIGEYIAYELAKCGCKLVLSARRQGELERVKKQCLAVGNIPDTSIMLLPMDVLHVDQHKENFDKILQTFGQLDILVNNAGRTQRARWEEIALEVDRQMFELNLFSLVALTRVVLPHFLERKAGHVVVMSSLAGIIGVPGSASYCGSKHALHGYMETLRMEKMSFNIAVTLLCPGPVHSNLLTTAFTDKPNEVYDKEWYGLDKRMATDRCAHLSVVAIANKLPLSLICLNPILTMTYLYIYFPRLSLSVLKMFGGTKKLSKMRDGNARPTSTKEK